MPFPEQTSALAANRHPTGPAAPADAPPFDHRQRNVEAAPRRFDFARDTFAFANELVWEYQIDGATGRMRFSKRVPPPRYAHRCFVLTRAARQFFLHARFSENQPAVSDEEYRELVKAVLARRHSRSGSVAERIVIPGFDSLRTFSRAREALLKSCCGGAWRSYLVRSHWRMIFPVWRGHQARTAARLQARIASGDVPAVHLVRFPRLSINHSLVLFDTAGDGRQQTFAAYDPNQPGGPTQLCYEAGNGTFYFPANAYWAGGRVDVIHVFRSPAG